MRYKVKRIRGLGFRRKLRSNTRYFRKSKAPARAVIRNMFRS